MGWAKFDDRWATHPKLLAAGLEAKGLDASGICYAAGQETDGFVPDAALLILAAGHRNPRKVADRLVDVGRWSRDDERRGYVIHDYLDYNQSREAAEAKREVERQRKASGRKNQGRDPSGRITSARTGTDVRTESASRPPGQNGVSARIPTPVPPVPTRPDPLSPPNLPGSHDEAAPDSGALTAPEKDQDQGQPHDGCGDPGCGHCTPRPPQDIGLEPGKPCEGCDECSPPDPLAERLATLWPNRPRMVAESKAVVATCRTVAADDVIDEAIGTMLSLDSPPRTPRYLLSTVLNRLVAGGAYGEGDPRLDVLRTKTPAVRG